LQHNLGAWHELVTALTRLVVTSEYSSGTIRSTFAAVPRRRTVLGAKSLVVVGTVLVVGTVACLGAFLAGQAILAPKGVGVSLFASGELRAVLGGGLYLAVLALLGVGLGAILRHTAGAISAFVGLVLVLPIIVRPLPQPWGHDISKFLPANAGQALLDVHGAGGGLAPWTGFAVLCAWAAAAVGLAAWRIVRRDA
jgi:hypothetical protein